jgi:hypothetical protein
MEYTNVLATSFFCNKATQVHQKEYDNKTNKKNWKILDQQNPKNELAPSKCQIERISHLVQKRFHLGILWTHDTCTCSS